MIYRTAYVLVVTCALVCVSGCAKPLSDEVVELPFFARDTSYVPESSSFGMGFTSKGAVPVVSGTSEEFAVVGDLPECGMTILRGRKFYQTVSRVHEEYRAKVRRKRWGRDSWIHGEGVTCEVLELRK